MQDFLQMGFKRNLVHSGVLVCRLGMSIICCWNCLVGRGLFLRPKSEGKAQQNLWRGKQLHSQKVWIVSVTAWQQCLFDVSCRCLLGRMVPPLAFTDLPIRFMLCTGDGSLFHRSQIHPSNSQDIHIFKVNQTVPCCWWAILLHQNGSMSSAMTQCLTTLCVLFKDQLSFSQNMWHTLEKTTTFVQKLMWNTTQNVFSYDGKTLPVTMEIPMNIFRWGIFPKLGLLQTQWSCHQSFLQDSVLNIMDFTTNMLRRQHQTQPVHQALPCMGDQFFKGNRVVMCSNVTTMF